MPAPPPDALEHLGDTLDALLLDPSDENEHFLLRALERAEASGQDAPLLRVARRVLHGPPVELRELPEALHQELLERLAEQQVTGDYEPEWEPAFALLERSEPDYPAVRDAVARALRDDELDAAERRPLAPELARAWALGALDAERTHLICARVERGEAGALGPLAELLQRQPELADTSDLLAEEPTSLHRFRLALALARIESLASRREAAAVPPVLLLRAERGEREEPLQTVSGDLLIGPEHPLDIDLARVPGVERWSGRRAELLLGEGQLVLASGRVEDDGIATLHPGDVLAELAALLPEPQVDLALLFAGRSKKSSPRLVLRIGEGG